MYLARLTTGMDFRILGPLEVVDEGRAVALGGSRLRALLAVLLLHANETVTSDRLIDDLWGERPPAGAARAVQVQISRLRKALASEAADGLDSVVVTRERGYELRLDPEQSTHTASSGSWPRVGASWPAVTPSARRRRWRRRSRCGAASRWQSSPTSRSRRARSPGSMICGSQRWSYSMDAKLALGGHAEVVGQLEVLIGEHPYRERFRAQLMLALYRWDRQVDALQAYQDARRVLVEELGIEPGEHLRELERAILAQDPG